MFAKIKSPDFIQLVIGYALVLIALWTPERVQSNLIWIGFAWIIATTVLARPTARELGLCPAASGRLFWLPTIALLVAAPAIWLASELHTLHGFSASMFLGERFWVYMVWAVMQQFILQDYFLFRVLRLGASNSVAVPIAAILFAVAHIPNTLLALATLVWGTVACALFLRYRNLYALGLAHGILGICIAVTVPTTVQHGMRVGLGYFHHQNRQTTRVLPQPDGPDGVHRSMRDCGGEKSPVGSPRAAIENTRQGGQQNIAPIEMRGAFVEMR